MTSIGKVRTSTNMEGNAVYQDLLRSAQMLGKIRSPAMVSTVEHLCSVRLWAC